MVNPIPLFILLITFSANIYADTLTWVGCGISKKAFMTELAAAYEKKTGTKIDLQGGGATKGIRAAASMTSDMGGTCRYRISSEIEELKASLIPLAWDALAVIVNPQNPVSNISIEQLQGIFLGKIVNWKELGGPDQEIAVYARKGKISGVGYALRQLVFDNVDQDLNASKFFPSTGPLEKSIESSPWAIGVTGVASAQKRSVKLLQLENREPSYENIKNGSYLLYRPLYIAVNTSGPHYAQVRKFIEFAHSKEGRNVIRKAGSVPYMDALNLRSIRTRQNKGKIL